MLSTVVVRRDADIPRLEGDWDRLGPHFAFHGVTAKTVGRFGALTLLNDDVIVPTADVASIVGYAQRASAKLSPTSLSEQLIAAMGGLLGVANDRARAKLAKVKYPHAGNRR